MNKSDRERHIPLDFTYKNGKNRGRGDEKKQNKNRLIERKNKLTVARGRSGGTGEKVKGNIVTNSEITAQ